MCIAYSYYIAEHSSNISLLHCTKSDGVAGSCKLAHIYFVSSHPSSAPTLLLVSHALILSRCMVIYPMIPCCFYTLTLLFELHCYHAVVTAIIVSVRYRHASAETLSDFYKAGCHVL